jgi:autotransporter-associated beta strand protein
MNLVKVDNCFPVTTMLTLGSTTQNGLIRIDNGSSITLGGLQVAAGAPGASTLNGINANSTSLQSTLTINAAQYSSFYGRLGATGAASQNLRLVKTGPAAFTLSTSANTYTGATEILGGTLEVESGSINNTSGITINGGRLMYGSTTALTKPVTLTSGTIGGTGSIGAAVTVGASGTISPGGDVDATGALSETIATQNYTAGLTLAPSGTYRFDATTTTGDVLAVTGTGLAITATNANPFVIDVHSQGLTPGTGYTRTLATSSAAIGAFAADQFAVLGDGVGSVSLSDPNTLTLNFTTLLPVYWDTNGTAAGAGGAAPAGNWDGAAANFNTDSTGGAGGATLAGTANFHSVVFAAGADGAGTYAVNLTGTQTAYGVEFARGNVTLSGGTLAAGTFTAAAGASGTVASLVTGGPTGAVVKQGAGTVTLAGANAYAGGTTVAAGTLVAANANAIGAGGALAVNAGATMRSQAGVSNALDVGALSIAATGKLDLNDGGLVKRNGGSGAAGQTATQQVTAALKTGLENGGNFDWLGSGISSTEAAADNATAGSVLYGVGVVQNNLAAAGTANATTTDATPGNEIYTSFKGRTVGLNDVLVRYTYMGDADLSGDVNSTDYSLIDSGFALSLSGWLNGDFDYSGAIDATDYALIDNAFAFQTGPLSSEFLAMYDLHADTFGQSYVQAFAAVQAGAVPEPGTLGVLALAGVGLLARRRARR